MITLIKTKWFIPRPPVDFVSRPRLIELLDEGATRKLTLVSAPAGFGKTSLVADWAVGTLTRGQLRLAWVSLDGGDNDVGRFFAYFMAALQTIDPQLGASLLTALQSPQPPSVAEFLPTLINELSMLSETVLVLDDYHLIENDEIHEAIMFLLEHAPRSFHLFLTVRHDPPFSLLPRLQVRRQLTHLSARDLRFTATEAAHFLNQAMSLQLTEQQIISLEKRTEGWIAGLQLAALSMRGRTSSQKSDFISNLSGGHQYLVDYLAEEILNQQTPRIQRFLKQTAILSRLSAALCDAVTESTDSQALLERLAKDNLFVIALDDERHWYRYHRLFAGFLQNQLTDEDRQEVKVRHTRAATWFAHHEFHVESIEHALAGQDYKLAISQITAVAMTMMAGGEYKTLLRWLQALPDELVRQRADLALPYAYVLSRLYEWQQVTSYLEAAEHSLSEGTPFPLPPSVRQFAYATLHFIRSVIFLGQGNLTEAISSAEEALSCMPSKEKVVRQLIISQLGTIYQLQGDWVTARQWFTRLAAIRFHAPDVKAELMLLNNKAGAEATQGHWHAAARHYRQALQLAQTHRLGHLPLIGAVHIGLGQVLLTWFDLSAAYTELFTGIGLVEETGMIEAWLMGLILLAHVKLWQDEPVASKQWLEQAVAIVQRVNIPQIDVLFAALEARFYLMQGAPRKALSWLRASGLQADGSLVHLHMTEYLVVARLMIAQGKYSEALALLAQIQAVAQVAEQMPMQIEATILQALTHEKQGERKKALTALRQALELAEPEGYITLFVEGGAEIAILLQTLQPHTLPGFLPDYVDELTDILSSRFKRVATQSAASPDIVPLLDPLTERELEILPLIAQGYSNKAIAKELFVAVSTVRTHLKNLYSKLDARSRTHAIARARELNLLD